VDKVAQAFFETLLRAQFLPADRMLVYQRGLLERLLRHARAQVPFYRDSGRLDVLFTADDQIDWKRWHEVPVLTRSEAQAHNEALFAETLPPECGEVQNGQTSGSTGKPLKFRVNNLMAAAGSAMIERGLVWADVPPPAVVAWIRYDYTGTASYPMGALYTQTMRNTPRLLHVLTATTPIEDQAKWLMSIKPDLVMSYPNSLAMLGQALPSGFDHQFRLAICNGEVTSDNTRASIERSFGCKAMDLYSGSEMGPIAIEDARTGQLFLCEETTFVEPLDDAASQRGGLTELMVTPLYNYAMPLIRYVTGDYATFDTSPAPDDRTLRRLGTIAGRERNLFVLPSGKKWWPYLIASKDALNHLTFDQFQFVQTQRNRIEFRFVSQAAQPLKDAAALLAILRAAVPEPMEFEIKQVPEIARHASGKFEEYVCAIDREPA
jgi:phenylacetate-CoA ligase